MNLRSRPFMVWMLPLAVLAVALFALAGHAAGVGGYMRNALLMSGEALRHPTSAFEIEFASLTLLGGMLSIVFVRFGIGWAALFAAAAEIGTAYGSRFLYRAYGVPFDALVVGLGIAGVLVACALARALEIRAMRWRLKSTFGDTLPPATIEKIARNPALLKLDGETRTVSCLSCGVRGFADLAASFRDNPAAFAGLAHRVLAPLMDEARKHGGTLDRLTSDGFTAFWNAPLDDPQHAVRACEAADGIMRALSEINYAIDDRQFADDMALSPVEIGIGIASGVAVAGGVRARGRMGYAVHGACVAQAAHIRQLSAQYGPLVIVGETTRKAAEQDFAFLEIDCIAAGAKDEPVKLYALQGNPMMRASPKFRALATFHDHIFQALRLQQWEKSRELIKQCRQLSGASPKLYDLYLARIAYFEANPPGADWDGAFRPGSANP